MSSMSIVENKSFRALIEGAQQLTRPPKLMCRRTCNNKIADAYTEYKDDDDNDDILALNEFPEPQENDLYQLPNHERCATHTLHLIPARDFDKARNKNNSYRKLHDAAMAKCQAVWNLCSRSPKASEIYLEVTGKSSTSPCPTRWNSYYNCITDILQIQETINEALRKLGLSVLKEIEIQFLVEYVKTSKPIAEAIRSLEGDKEIYYGCLQPELIRMQKILASLEIDNPVYCGPLIEIIKENIQRRFEKFDLDNPRSKDSILAAVSYPFFKLKWVPKNLKMKIQKVASHHRHRKEKEEIASLITCSRIQTPLQPVRVVVLIILQ
ncbi:hypothetical protein HW555_011021 [Spodoptera exigua]|uniref:Uncharacterized protein n=1 Tax=Spodoptera exigua TaxID=7107 RepID=A0A835G7V2_SPOEX|nr:hypothetical protein HW555_011021 [Spodoptera exigua]